MVVVAAVLVVEEPENVQFLSDFGSAKKCHKSWGNKVTECMEKGLGRRAGEMMMVVAPPRGFG